MINLVSNNYPLDNDFWSQIRLSVKQHLNAYGPKMFFSWQPIKFTMLVENAEYTNTEKRYIVNKNANQYWLTELPALQDNSAHHLYHIHRWLDATKTDITQLESVIEFGGGYGSTCKLFHQLGFNGVYTIYDFPEFNRIQKYYLKDIKVEIKESDDLQWDTDLFIAEWSLSEANKKDREEVLECLAANHLLLAYSEMFGENNNIEYFTDLTKDFKICLHEEIAHLPKHYYLFASI